MLNASLNFVGQGLTFQANGPGMSIDPATGQVTISSDVLLSGIEVTVTDGNSGGSTVSRFRVTVAAQEDAVVKPAPLMAPTLSGTGVIGASVAVDPGQWSGQPEPTLALQWRAGEVAIPGATAAAFEPTAAEDGADLDCLVTATNAGGSEALAAGPLRVTQAPPVALGAIADLVLTQGDAPGRVEAAGLFSGTGLSFSVEGAGAEVDASGVISVPTGALLAEEAVVTASNSGGSAEIRFHVTVAKQKDPVVKPALLVAPTLSGTGVIGASVAVDPGQWSGQPEPTLALQWRAGEVAIPGATAAAFEPTAAEDGADLDCLVTATNAGGSEALAAGPLRVTQAPPVALGAIADLVLTQGGAPGRVEAAGHFAGGSLSFSVAGAGAVIDAASGVISVSTGALFAEEPVVVTARNSGGSVTSQFRVTVSPAKLDPSLIQIYEITAAADPDKGNGGRRRLIIGDVTIPSGYELRWSSPEGVDGGVPPGSLVTPNTTFVRRNGLPVGTINYNVLHWYRQSDGAVFNALPPSGATANGKAITATLANAADGQIILTIVGLASGGGDGDGGGGTWPSIGATAIADASSFAYASFTNKNNAASNITQRLNFYVAMAYESFRGTTSTDAFVLAQLDVLLAPSTMPFAVAGAPAIREASAITFFQLVKLTPRLWDTLSATKKSQMEWIVRALLVGNAWMASDNHTQQGSADWSLTGFASDVKSVGPNMAFGMVANIINACCYLGAAEASSYLQTVTMSNLRSQIASLFGTSSQLYKTLNWRNEGVSASGATSYFRSAASSLAPPDATIEAALRNFKYYGASLSNLESMLFPNSTRSLNRCLPPTRWTDKPANLYIGVVQYACLDNVGITIGSTVYGTCLNNKLSTPHLGDYGCMIYELSGQDDGGVRSSLGYAMWTKAGVDCVLLSLAVTGATNMASSAMADFLHRWSKANDVIEHFDVNDYRGCSHNVKNSSGAYTSTKSGANMPNPWSSERHLAAIPSNKAVWTVIKTKLGVSSA